MDWMCWLAVMLATGPMADAHKPIAKKPANDPNIRMEQLLNVVEDVRNVYHETRCHWFKDEPSHLTPIRTHGGVGP